MLYKLFVLSVLLYGAGADAVRPLTLHKGQKISKLKGEALIQAACSGVADDVSECISTLQTAPPDQKNDAHALVIFTLEFVDVHAENITDGIKKINAMPDVAPLLQSALTECLEQYNSLDDVIEDSIIAVQSKNYPDAQKFVMASLSSLDLCDSRLKSSDFEEKTDNKTGPDFEMATGLYKYNVLHKTLLFAALNILSVD